ncbi:MAG TPA: hypothetical protein VKO16_14205, partial [Polyangia bacterium]|nr:hypothetical protein [Polyangia bacterium]
MIDRIALARIVSIAAVFVSACGRTVSSAPAPATEIPSPPIRTTSGEIATHNFLAELAQAEKQHAARPGDLTRTRALADHLFGRAQFFGKLGDYDEAESIGRAALAIA